MNKNGIVLSQKIYFLSASHAAFSMIRLADIVNCVIVRSYLFLYTVFTTSGSGYFSFYFHLRRSQ